MTEINNEQFKPIASTGGVLDPHRHDCAFVSRQDKEDRILDPFHNKRFCARDEGQLPDLRLVSPRRRLLLPLCNTCRTTRAPRSTPTSSRTEAITMQATASSPGLLLTEVSATHNARKTPPTGRAQRGEGAFGIVLRRPLHFG